jgi:hypothetical protein
MACVIVATSGSVTANSYATIAEADLYFETHPYSSVWDDASDDEKCRALVTATRLLDTWYEWNGIVSSSTQALLWPRQDAYGPNGYLHLSNEIPERIVQATAELAKALLVSDRTADSDLQTQGITSLRAGSVALTFQNAMAKPIPDAVDALVSVYGRRRSVSGSGTVHLYRA